jgi:hypothetical protein
MLTRSVDMLKELVNAFLNGALWVAEHPADGKRIADSGQRAVDS